MRLRLTIAYDGRPFAGWQSQPGGNTVQDHLERAMGVILKTAPPPVVHGSGRTDAGVHALGQVAHCEVPDHSRMDEAAWRRALNVHLPPGIRVMEVHFAEADFHARFDAAGKTYRYRIWNDEVLPPLEAGLAWHIPHRLDFPLLAEACRLCEGTHDFKAFAANRGDGKDDGRDTVRHLWSVTLSQEGPCLTLTFHGSGFLYKMVRMLTGSLMRVAMGRVSVSWLTELLTTPAGKKTHHTAPADGLCLVQVDYANRPESPVRS
ncbi:MAG TPA: tRNA pseudouridine(38-40) synthase TruA [Verrucomicrobiales bacterium]|nr:tRNA pseudouridine(38-40) synthase TruA [Verrucomicrobiales bacterium]